MIHKKKDIKSNILYFLWYLSKKNVYCDKTIVMQTRKII